MKYPPCLPPPSQRPIHKWINEWGNQSKCLFLTRAVLRPKPQVQEAKLVSGAIQPRLCNLLESNVPIYIIALLFIFLDISWEWDEGLRKEIFILNFTAWYNSCMWPLTLPFHRIRRHPFRTAAAQLRFLISHQHRKGSNLKTRCSITLKREHNIWESRGQKLQGASFLPRELDLIDVSSSWQKQMEFAFIYDFLIHRLHRPWVPGLAW